jgi:VPDSG-CTERM motif
MEFASQTANMKKYLACTLMAVALAISAQAGNGNGNGNANGNGNGNGRDDDPPTMSVPDSGSTALLLGTAFAALAVARRRLTIR